MLCVFSLTPENIFLESRQSTCWVMLNNPWMYLYIISLHCSFIPSIVLATTENNTMINIILIIVITGFSGIRGNLVLARWQCIVLQKYLILVLHWDQKTITPIQTNQLVHTMYVCKDWLLLYKRAIEFAWLPSKYQYWITTEWQKKLNRI